MRKYGKKESVKWEFKEGRNNILQKDGNTQNISLNLIIHAKAIPIVLRNWFQKKICLFVIVIIVTVFVLANRCLIKNNTLSGVGNTYQVSREVFVVRVIFSCVNKSERPK
jgi:hypothetical protein